MASIYGFKVRKIVDFKGHELEPCVQCDVLYKGKKVAFFSDDAHGGEYWWHPESLRDRRNYEELAKQAYKKYLENPIVPDVYKLDMISADLLVHELILLDSLEREFIRRKKAGFDGIVFAQSEKLGDKDFGYAYRGEFQLATVMGIAKDEGYEQTTIFNSLSQFIVE